MLTLLGRFFVINFSHSGSLDDHVAVVTIQHFPDGEKVQRIEYPFHLLNRQFGTFFPVSPVMIMLQAGVIGIIDSGSSHSDTDPNLVSFNTYTNCVGIRYLAEKITISGQTRIVCADTLSTPFHFWRHRVFIPAYVSEENSSCYPMKGK